MCVFVIWPFDLSELTRSEVRGRAAAGDSQVVGVLLGVQEADVHVPQFQVAVGAAGHEDLATRREATRHDTGLAHWTASVWETTQLNRKGVK